MSSLFPLSGAGEDSTADRLTTLGLIGVEDVVIGDLVIGL